MKNKIEYMLHSNITDERLLKILSQIYDLELYKEKFYTVPGSLKYHHSETGGLANHTYDVMKNVEVLATYHELDKFDTELLVLSAFIHDLGKMNVYNDYGNGWTRSDIYDNNSLSSAPCIYGTVDILKGLTDIDEDIYNSLVNLVHSHHGVVEWGSVFDATIDIKNYLLFIADYFSSQDNPELVNDDCDYISVIRLNDVHPLQPDDYDFMTECWRFLDSMAWFEALTYSEIKEHLDPELDINLNDVFEEVSINLTDVRIKPHVDNPTDEINDQYELDFQSEHVYVFDQDLEPHQFLTTVAQDVLDFYSDRGDVMKHEDVENVFAVYGDVIKGDGSQMYYIPKDEEALLNLIRYKLSVEMDKIKFDIDYKKGE